MGTSHGDFIKYPRTPHLLGSKGTDDGFILFGEWVYARHSVLYRQLTHYFFEFDRDDEVLSSVSEPDVNSDSSASARATSEDGRLSLRIVTAHGPIRADEPVWVLAELRNDSDESDHLPQLAVFKVK